MDIWLLASPRKSHTLRCPLPSTGDDCTRTTLHLRCCRHSHVNVVELSVQSGQPHPECTQHMCSLRMLRIFVEWMKEKARNEIAMMMLVCPLSLYTQFSTCVVAFCFSVDVWRCQELQSRGRWSPSHWDLLPQVPLPRQPFSHFLFKHQPLTIHRCMKTSPPKVMSAQFAA